MVLNEKRSDGTVSITRLTGDYKPAGWNKTLPAMSQISWVQDQMQVQNLKDESKFQADTFAVNGLLLKVTRYSGFRECIC